VKNSSGLALSGCGTPETRKCLCSTPPAAPEEPNVLSARTSTPVEAEAKEEEVTRIPKRRDAFNEMALIILALLRSRTWLF